MLTTFSSLLFLPALNTGVTKSWERCTSVQVCTSDPTVIGSVLEFAGEDEDGGEGGDRNVEDQLPHISHAKQVEIA